MRKDVKRDAGISLIEMVVAVLVLSIGVIAGFQSLAQARRGIGEELPRLFAQQVALNRAEEWQMLGAGPARALLDTVPMGGYVWQIGTEAKATEGRTVEATIRASASGQPGAIVVVYAPPGPPQ